MARCKACGNEKQSQMDVCFSDFDTESKAAHLRLQWST
jgi:hypothetical protein